MFIANYNKLKGYKIMNDLELSSKGKELIEFYKQMVKGYQAMDAQGNLVEVQKENAYSLFNISRFKDVLLPIFKENNIKTILDYGCGGSDWREEGFSNLNINAINFFDLKEVYKYEPARGINEKKKVDCVVCWDVLEHIFITDISKILRDIFSHANKMVLLNIACYKASATLPNKENAHITVRDKLWWKGFIDCISMDYPDTKIGLFCSLSYQNVKFFKIWNSRNWENLASYETSQF